VLEGILFDWNNTLARFTWSDELLEEGHRVALAALGREADAEDFTARYREELVPRLGAADAADTVDYRGELQALLGDGANVDAFMAAEHAAWAPATELAATTHGLLEALRNRGLKLAVVANAWPDAPALLRAQLERLGVAERVDAIVLADEVGKRKPSPAPFRAALEQLGVAPEAACFVGDSLRDDVAGAAELGMTTIQALWFRADDASEAAHPDHQAFTQVDVLNIVRRINGESA
jgi:HAD superfamily hydrolase (TIGR01509 family)